MGSVVNTHPAVEQNRFQQVVLLQMAVVSSAPDRLCRSPLQEVVVEH